MLSLVHKNIKAASFSEFCHSEECFFTQANLTGWSPLLSLNSYSANQANQGWPTSSTWNWELKSTGKHQGLRGKNLKCLLLNILYLSTSKAARTRLLISERLSQPWNDKTYSVLTNGMSSTNCECDVTASRMVITAEALTLSCSYVDVSVYVCMIQQGYVPLTTVATKCLTIAPPQEHQVKQWQILRLKVLKNSLQLHFNQSFL